MSRRVSPLAGFQVTINGRFWVTAEDNLGMVWGQAKRLADIKDNGDHSSGGSEPECDGIILFGTTTKLVLAPAWKGTNFAGLEGHS